MAVHGKVPGLLGDLHGLNFRVTATDGGFVPETAQVPETTSAPTCRGSTGG